MVDLRDALERAHAAWQQRCAQLGIAPEADWLAQCPGALAQRVAARVADAGHCQVIGISGAQGTGKTTLALLMHDALSAGFGLRSVVVSLDDYYLTKAERRALAAQVHPLLVTRGVPGTHATDVLQAALRRLRMLSPGQSMGLPRFSKAEDDRLHELQISTGPVEVVLFEGWCVGARPEPEPSLREPVNALEAEEDVDGRFRRYVNAQLAGPYADLWRELDMLVYLAAPNMDAVRAFRSQQEDRLRQLTAGDAQGIMDRPAILRFVQHFERVTAHMLRTTPGYADVVVELDASRRCHLRDAQC